MGGQLKGSLATHKKTSHLGKVSCNLVRVSRREGFADVVTPEAGGARGTAALKAAHGFDNLLQGNLRDIRPRRVTQGLQPGTGRLAGACLEGQRQLRATRQAVEGQPGLRMHEKGRPQRLKPCSEHAGGQGQHRHPRH